MMLCKCDRRKISAYGLSQRHAEAFRSFLPAISTHFDQRGSGHESGSVKKINLMAKNERFSQLAMMHNAFAPDPVQILGGSSHSRGGIRRQR
jgi:hypothetical protein